MSGHCKLMSVIYYLISLILRKPNLLTVYSYSVYSSCYGIVTHNLLRIHKLSTQLALREILEQLLILSKFSDFKTFCLSRYCYALRQYLKIRGGVSNREMRYVEQ